MAIKALFFDLDGTLLDDAKRIPPSAQEALRSCRAKGVRVYLASARSPRLGETLGWSADEFALFDGGIYSNGGYVEAEGLGRYAFIDAQTVAHCVAAVQAHPHVHLSLHTPGHGYSFNFDPSVDIMRAWGITPGNLRPLNADTMQQTAKMLVFWGGLVDEKRLMPPGLFEQLQSICTGKARLYLTDQGCTMQITSLEAGKRSAVQWVQAQLGLQPDELAVFGDDLNDLEMLTAFPVSVAMGNAADEVKAMAAHVTRSNQEDGIAHALRHILRII